MIKKEVVIVGGGPAGLAAAIEVAKTGAKVLVIDENKRPGGQLFKQIHKFFGSKAHNLSLIPIYEERLFLDTLRLYIVLRNIGDVATLLGIHANSVKYRIAKCLKYFGYKDTNVLGDIPSVKLLILLETMALDD